jgi:hypothetical protein
MFNPFRRNAGVAWQRIGLASELPDLHHDEGYRIAPRCKAFNIPKEGGSSEPVEDIDMPGDMKDQVLVFKYKGKVHAVDHVSVHPGMRLPCRWDPAKLVYSNVLTRHSRCHRAIYLTLKTLELL